MVKNSCMCGSLGWEALSLSCWLSVQKTCFQIWEVFQKSGKFSSLAIKRWKSRVWKSQKCDKMYFPHTRTSWDKYMFIVIPKLKFQDRSELFGCAGKYTEQSTHCALGHLHWSSSWQWQLCIAVCRLFRTLLLTELADLAHFLQNVSFKNLTKLQNLFGVIFSSKTARKIDPKCFQNILSWLQSVGFDSVIFYRRIHGDATLYYISNIQRTQKYSAVMC